jgi:hypothetical protein|tara:strand:+ start:2032 stop:2220 length:189 start_codon:yes stop_codon:yes gene_type:complete
MELIKRYKGYNITIKGLRVEANNGIDFIILTLAPIKNKSSKYINNFIYKSINHRIKYLLKQS